MRVLIAYLSYSGNTKEVAELIEQICGFYNCTVDVHRIGVDAPVLPSDYDYIFLGTFTWGEGSTPDEVKDFIIEVGYKPKNMAIFGTGDTQFGGDDLFCLAVDKLVTFYDSPWEGLKIEQSPRGSQEKLINDWLGGILNHVTHLA